MKRWQGVLFLLVLILFFGLATGFAVYYRLLYILGLAFLGSYFWGYLSVRGLTLEVQRRGLRVQVGDTIEERITVRSTSRLPKAWLEVQDLTTLPGPQPGRVLRLEGRGERTWLLRILATRRGSYTLGPAQVTASDFFGLFQHRRLFSEPQEVLVLPATVSLPTLRLPIAGLSGEGVRQRRALQPTPHASSVREYLPSDSYSRIHWPTTARTGRLMVKQFDEGVGNHLWLLVDLHQDIQVGTEREVTDEQAVTVAASVARKYLGLRVPVGLVTSGDEMLSVPASLDAGQLPQLLTALASARAEGQIPLADILSQEWTQFQRSSTLMVITPSTDPEWVAHLAPLMQRGILVTAVLVDPISFGGSNSIEPVLERLLSSSVPSYVVRRGESLTTALAAPYRASVPVGVSVQSQESMG